MHLLVLVEEEVASDCFQDICCYWSLLEPTLICWLVLCLSINIFVKYLLLVVGSANFFLVGFMFEPTLLANIYRINSLTSQLCKKISNRAGREEMVGS